MFSVCVKTINGKLYNYEMNDNSKINDLKEKILYDVGIPIDYQYLSYKGRLLHEDKFLYNYLKKQNSHIIIFLVNKFLGA